ncbi:MAG: ABC transporter permease [Anaerolineales bacterium]
MTTNIQPRRPTAYSLFSTFYSPLSENPVIRKELRGRMRGRQGFTLLIFYLVVISLLTILIYSLVATEGSYAPWNPDYRQEVGKAVFGTVVLLELTLVALLGPSLTSGAIAAERERQTLELLRTTLLSARSLVIGKLGSSLAFLFLLIFSALPIQSIAFLLGGVGLAELLVSALMLAVTALFFCALGLFFSSILKRTTAATVSSYATILLTTLIGGGIFLWVAISEASYSYGSNTFLSTTHENFLNLVLWMLISTNPLLAAISSESVLVDEQNLFYTNAANNSSLIGSSTFYLPSPWIIFTLVYLLLAMLLILLSVYFVKRPER